MAGTGAVLLAHRPSACRDRSSQREGGLMIITASRGRNSFDSNPEPRSFENFELFKQFIVSDRALEKGLQYITGLCKVAPQDARHQEQFAASIGKPHRCKDCVSERSWLGLDIDGCLSAHSFEILKQVLVGYNALLYTTASHTENAPRCRVIIELDRAVDRSIFMQVSRHVRDQIDSRMNGEHLKWDAACDRPEQALYLPLVTTKYWNFNGPPIKVGDIEISPNESPQTPSEPVPFVGNEDPVAVMEWITQIERVKRAQKGKRNPTINSASYFLGELIGAGRLQHDLIVHSLMEAAEPWGEPVKQRKKILAGIASGRQNPKFMDSKSETGWRAGNARIETLAASSTALTQGPTLPLVSPNALVQLNPLSHLSPSGQMAINQFESKVLLKRGDTVVPESIDWLWEGWLACGKMHIIGGAPGCGKTTIACKLAATVTTGGLWPDGTRAPVGDVVIWSGEDDIENVLAPRMIASGADMKRVQFIVGVRENGKDVSFDPSKDLSKLEETLSGLSDVRLLVIDPIVSTVSGDSHRNAEVRRALQPLVDLTTKLDCALIGITHFTKGTQGRDPVERITGSLAFAALARVVMVASMNESGDEPRSDRLLVRAKSNLGPSTGGFSYSLAYEPLTQYPGVTGSNVIWGDELTGSAREILGQAEATIGSDDPGCLETCKDWLTKYLGNGGVLAEAVQRAGKGAGHSLATLKRAKAALGVKSKRFHDKWVWLPSLKLEGEQAAQGDQGVQEVQVAQVVQSSLPMPPPSLDDYWRANPQPIVAQATGSTKGGLLRLPPKLT